MAADPLAVRAALEAGSAAEAVRLLFAAGATPFPLAPESKLPACSGFCAQPVRDGGGHWPDAESADELVDRFIAVADGFARRGLPRQVMVGVEPARGLGLAVLDLDIDDEKGKNGIESWRAAGMPMNAAGEPVWPHRVRTSRGWHLYGTKPDDGDPRRLWKDGGKHSGVDMRHSRSFVRVFAHGAEGNRLRVHRRGFWGENWMELPTGLFAPVKAEPKPRPRLAGVPMTNRPQLGEMDALPSHRVPDGWPDLTAALPASGARRELIWRGKIARGQYGWSEQRIAAYYQAISGEPAYDLDRLAAWIAAKYPANVSAKAQWAAMA